ncbi:MAG: DNA-directed RNA polymerase subunit alpha [Nitrospirota bacterium]
MIKDFQIPKGVVFEEETLTSTYGKFYSEPFERGFGVTIGNSLRRVLLSSIVGSAITSIKIEGVLHEFSTIPGVKEDVTEIILNIKNLRLKLHSDKPKALHLKKKGPGKVLAKDIMENEGVDILTPDFHILTLDKNGSIDIEMIAKLGRGYVPSERNKEDNMPIGVIPVDSIFTPIKKVKFVIENARVGRITDYDKLIMEMWTDGSITPHEALNFAIEILEEHLKPFKSLDNKEEEVAETLLEDIQQPQHNNKNLLKSVNELELSVRATNCLKNVDINTIGELVKKTENEMLRTKNFGRKSLNEIKEALLEMGLGFGMRLEDFPSDEQLEDNNDE